MTEPPKAAEPQKPPILIQWPNGPLAVAIVGWIVHQVSSGWLQTVSLVVYIAALLFWAVWELATGINWFRRLLGGAVLVSTIMHIIRLVWF